MKRRIRANLTSLVRVLLLVGLVVWFIALLDPEANRDLGRLSLQVQAWSLAFAGVLVIVLVGYAGLKEHVRRRDRKSERLSHESAHKV